MTSDIGSPTESLLAYVCDLCNESNRRMISADTVTVDWSGIVASKDKVLGVLVDGVFHRDEHDDIMILHPKYKLEVKLR